MCDLYEALNERGLLDYGSVIPAGLIMEIAGIEPPKYGSWSDFQKLELQMLTLTGALRDTLLGEGKYLRGEKGDYRILLPSENLAQARSMVTSGDAKYRRAKKLLDNTPGEVSSEMQSEKVRIVHKRDAAAVMREGMQMLT